MEAKDRKNLEQEILKQYPGLNPEMDVDWDIVEISFKAGYEGAKEEMNLQTASLADMLLKHRQAGTREVMEPSDELLEIGRKAIEDVLVDWRDNRMSEFNRGNGLVIREEDGRDSNIIRFGPETALKIGLKAMGQAFLKERGASISYPEASLKETY